MIALSISIIILADIRHLNTLKTRLSMGPELLMSWQWGVMKILLCFEVDARAGCCEHVSKAFWHCGS